jgi:hypothetical protein
MNKVFLLGLILLFSMTAVVAVTHFSTMYFEGELLGEVYPIKQAGYFKWGSWNGAPVVTIQEKGTKTFTAHSVDGNQVTVIFYDDTYWSNGEIKFNANIPIGVTTPVTEFEAKFIDIDKTPTSLWTYRINDRDINGDNFYAIRRSKNQYDIVCNNEDLNTITLYNPLGWVSGDAKWNFEATIVI